MPAVTAPGDAGLDEASVGLRHHVSVIARRRWIVVAVTALAVAAAVGISMAQSPLYEAQTKIVVTQGYSLVQPGFANAVQPYTATMSDLIKSNVVASDVIRRLHLSRTPEALLRQVKVSINPQTAVLAVSVNDHSRIHAQEIAHGIGVVFSGLVEKRFGRSAPTPAGQQALPPLTASVFDPAHVLPGSISPRPVRNGIIAAVLGLALGLLAAFFRDHFDRTLRTSEGVEFAFGVPVIGQIPFARNGRRDGSGLQGGFGEAAESFRALRANLQFLAVQRPLRTILISSASPRQGKTGVTANLAAAIARSGSKTIVLEGDLRRPKLAEALQIPAEAEGLTNVLVGASPLEEAIRTVPLPPEKSEAEATHIALIQSGPLPPNPSELLSSPQMSQLLERLELEYNHILIDSPPLLLVADALELARVVDGVVLVVRRNNARSDEAREVRRLVERLGIRLIGVIFTDVEPARGYGSYGSYAPQPRERRRRNATRTVRASEVRVNEQARVSPQEQ